MGANNIRKSQITRQEVDNTEGLVIVSFKESSEQPVLIEASDLLNLTPIPNLQEITDENSTTTNNITADSFTDNNGLIKPYKSYVAAITQASTSAPVANVLENNLGGVVVWARTATGVYTATLTGAFVLNKTWLNLHIPAAIQNDEYFIAFTRTNANVLTLAVSNNAGTPVDDFIGNIEVRIYN